MTLQHAHSTLTPTNSACDSCLPVNSWHPVFSFLCGWYIVLSFLPPKCPRSPSLLSVPTAITLTQAPVVCHLSYYTSLLPSPTFLPPPASWGRRARVIFIQHGSEHITFALGTLQWLPPAVCIESLFLIPACGSNSQCPGRSHIMGPAAPAPPFAHHPLAHHPSCCFSS